jgi:Tol biopolymer transport system component
VLANPTLSPDNSGAAVDITDVKAHNVDVWLSDLGHRTNSRITFDPAEDSAGSWSRDGTLVAYRSLPDRLQVFLKQAQGLQPAKSIFDLGVFEGGSRVTDDIIPNSWSRDDNEILCSWQPSTGGSDLVLVSVQGGKMVPFLTTKASETNGQISPDGKWVAYASNESADWEATVCLPY